MNKVTIIGLLSANILFFGFILFVGYGFTWEFPPFSTEDGSYYPSMLWGNVFNAIVVYTNALLLYPYRKKLWMPYWLAIFILVFVTAIIEAFVDYQLVFQLELVDKLDQLYEGLPGPRSLVIIDWTLQNLGVHFFYYMISFVFVFFVDNIKNQQIQKSLEKANLKAELNFLKAQINPHFLFNGINSVYFLIDEKPAIAKSTLLKFSDLLRYQLYECQDDFISLSKELAHIRDYVEMEQIRKGEDALITLTLPTVEETLQISPLLFSPFIENAFKYVSNFDEGTANTVDIAIRIDNQQLYFEATNTTDRPMITTSNKNKGIGIENVKKRLSLLYPQQHELKILEKEESYTVQLMIQLKN